MEPFLQEFTQKLVSWLNIRLGEIANKLAYYDFIINYGREKFYRTGHRNEAITHLNQTVENWKEPQWPLL